MYLEGFTPWPPDLVKEYIDKGYWKGLTVGETFEQTATKYPDKEVLVSEEVRITFSELVSRVKRVALGLLNLGIKKHDRIVLQLPNSPELAYIYLALAKIGAVGVWALPHHRHSEIGYLLRLTEGVGIVIPSEYRGFDYIEMVKQLRSGLSSLKYSFVVGKKVPEDMFSFYELIEKPIETEYPPDYLDQFKPDANDVLCLLLTGGTTSIPKVVPRTHNSMLLASSCGAQIRGHNTPGAVYFLNNHMSHGSAMQRFTGTLVQSGGKVVLRRHSLTEVILQVIDKEKVTHTGLVPTQALDLLNDPEFNKYDLGSLKCIDLPGAAATAELLRALKSKIGCSIIIAFGSNEGVLLSSRGDESIEMLWKGALRPICSGDELKIIDDDGREVLDGEVGELIGRGPNITRGYYKSPELNERSFDADGFWHTGDLFVKDKKGNFGCLGRKDDMILRGGENISAKEIEELLSSNPKVDSVAVVGMPDARLGQRACAYIKLKAGEKTTFEEIISFLKEKNIATFKLPERTEIINEFPLTHIGKISKKELREDITRKLKAEAKYNN
jgi:2,3-dihydroxybenzoate-AMP ligase